jgi:probable rRNA maturation factor
VAIALVTDAHMRKLNRTYRRKDKATDVLSFPSDTPGMLGDIVIARGVAESQAKEHGHALQTELRVLALHGLLHLIGYDHEAKDDNGKMRRAEERLRRKGGLKLGLIGRAAR